MFSATLSFIMEGEKGGDGMQDMGTKIRVACTLAGVSVAELARRIGTSPQNLNQRLKVGRFSTEELESMAQALGAEFRLEFIFPDGSKA